MKTRYILTMFFLILVMSCSQQPEANGNDTTVNVITDTNSIVEDSIPDLLPEFIPPEDEKITDEMADRYVACAIEIHKLIKGRAEMGREYLDSIGVTIEQLGDTAFVQENKEILNKYNEITSGENFLEIEKQIYYKNTISEDEFIWIASHLSDTENVEIQKKVAQALSDIIVP